MAFLIWRIWKFKVPVDNRIRRWGIEGPSMCWRCENPSQETMANVFIRSNIANRTCSYFSYFLGLNTEVLSFRKVSVKWWEVEIKKSVQLYYRVLPSILYGSCGDGEIVERAKVRELLFKGSFITF